ncbi:MAG: hypothetical protein ABIP94_00870 [Planctomycetota bacterium]
MHPKLRCTIPALSLALLTACSGGSSGGAQSRQRSSMLTVAAGPGGQFAVLDMMSVPVGGGTLDLQTALFGIAQISIEENTGEGSGQNGENEGGENNESGNESENENENESSGGSEGEGGESDLEDIVLTGPFTIDIANGNTVLEEVPVYPGTFRKVEIQFYLDPAAPLQGDSIYFSGQFQPNSGASINVTLRSRYADDMRVQIANGGVTVGGNASIPLTLTFDLGSLLGNLDFAGATVEGGEILIDAAHNTNLLVAFEQNIDGCVGAHDHDR